VVWQHTDRAPDVHGFGTERSCHNHEISAEPGRFASATPTVAHGSRSGGHTGFVDPEAELREYLEQLGRFVSNRAGTIRHGFVLLTAHPPRRRRHTTQELPAAVLDACADRSR